MRGLLLLLLAFLALPAFAQRAPNILRGTSEEAVIKLHGWPKGKSVTDGRESWLYDKFQVTFENGKVISVAYVSAGTANAVRPSQPVPVGAVSRPTPTLNLQTSPQSVNPKRDVFMGASATVPAAAKSSGIPKTISLTAAPVVPNDNQGHIVPTLTVPAKKSGPAAVPYSERASAARLSPFRIWSILLAAAFVGVLICVATLRAMRSRSRSLTTQLLERHPRAGGKKTPRTWEDHVAEKLRTVTGMQPVPPILTPNGKANPTERAAADRNHAPESAVSADLTLELLRKLEWRRFELLVERYYSATGVRAECTCAGADGGVDVKLFRGGEERAFCYVQCKAWGADKVNVRLVREFFGVMAADKIKEGIFITTSDFWPEARTFANANDIATLTADDFIALFRSLPAPTRRRIIAEVTDGDYTTPSCPSCEVKAVARERKRDGVKFWSCRCGWTMNARAVVAQG